MAGLRSVLILLGLTFGCALVGLCVGFAIGLEVASAHIESAPKEAGHGVAYVGAGICILISQAGLCVGAVLGLVLGVRYLRGRSKPDEFATHR